MNADARRPARIMVVDDEQTVREMVGLNLRADGYEVVLASDGHEALRMARTEHPDLVVLDVMLPGKDGFEVCRTLRHESHVPILLLSARGEEVDRIVGLELGADDYLTKPFAMRELVARVRAMLRRQRMAHSGTDEDDGGASSGVGSDERILIVGDLELNVSRHEARSRGRLLTLSAREFALLEYFARHPGIVLSRDALLREVWGYDVPISSRTVDVHVRWLRQKIEEDPATPSRILTVRGHGYRLVPNTGHPAGDGG